MQKTIIENEIHFLEIIKSFGKQWEEDLREVVKEFPCILISCHCIDIEYGEYYEFTSINSIDLIKLNRQQEICLN